MVNPYKELFGAPGTLAFSIAGLIARIPISMAGIGIITMLSQLRGSYWIAGVLRRLLLAIGITIFVLQKQTEPPVYPYCVENKSIILKMPSIQILILSLIALGTIVGTIDVISVAFAEQHGKTAAASIVLSVYAIGSCLSGLAFGSIKINIALPRMFMFTSLATMLTTIPLLLAHDVLTLAAMVFVSGLFFAPTMIVAMSLVENMVPSRNLTEGLTWMVTGLGIGIACGASVTGWVIDKMGIQSGFFVTLVAGIIIFLAAASGYRLMQRNMIRLSTLDTP